ncbi:hypothetical protein ACFRFQ_13185 [Rhodococcus sp. NPDC056743]
MREPHEGSFLTDLMELGPAPAMAVRCAIGLRGRNRSEAAR